MALETGVGLSSISPTNSGRSSPVPRAAAKRSIEESLYKADKALRRYGATIERALASWEISPQEWADYIAFLARLLKAIQTQPTGAPLLPHSDDIAYKLAQCLNPELPSGVHQKALEVYEYIFSTFGVSYISDHLHEFLPGLSPVLSFASLNVRPALYSLYEDHLLKMDPVDLRPVLKSLISGLLPGIEDDTSEDFERAFAILERLESLFVLSSTDITETLGADGIFWQCVFLIVISNPSRRQGALNYLTQKLPSFRTAVSAKDAENTAVAKRADGKLSAAAECVVTPEPGLLVRCFVCGLSDSQLLIQRGFLDLLVANIPLESILIREMIGTEDLDRLLSAVMHVLLRREMSLNRRLWSWFLGPEPKTETDDAPPTPGANEREQSNEDRDTSQLRYFSAYGKTSLERCVLAMFRRNTSKPTERARPFRICLSLMDRWEIGGTIVPRIFLPAIESVYQYSLFAPAEHTNEVLRSAGLFFDGVEASLIWADLITLMRRSIAEGEKKDGLLMIAWIIQNFNFKDEDMLLFHIPYAACYLLALLTSASSSGANTLDLAALDVVSSLLDMAPDRAFTSSTKKGATSKKPSGSLLDAKSMQRSLEDFYQSTDQSTELPFTGPAIFAMLSQLAASLSLRAIQEEAEPIINRTTTILIILDSKSNILATLNKVGIFDAIFEAVNNATSHQQTLPFSTLSSIMNLMSAFKSNQQRQSSVSNTKLAEIVPLLVRQFWSYLSPRQPKYHVEAVKSIWQLEDLVTPLDSLESSLTALLRGADEAGPTYPGYMADAVGKFGILWGHTIAAPPSAAKSSLKPMLRRASGMANLMDSKQSQRRQKILLEPLMIVLDSLDEANGAVVDVVKSWLQNLPTLENIFTIHFNLLSQCMEKDVKEDGHITSRLKRQHDDNMRLLDYLVGHIQNILGSANDWIWQCLDDMTLADKQASTNISGSMFLATRSCEILSNDDYAKTALQQKAIRTLQLLLSAPSAPTLKALNLDSRLTDCLIKWVSEGRTEQQVSLLSLLTLALKLPAGNDSGRRSMDRRPSSSAGTRKSSGTPTGVSNATALSSTAPPAQLLNCLQLGFSSPSSRLHLNQWVTFLSAILPTFADAVFANLLPLVESLCAELYKAHDELVLIAKVESKMTVNAPEAVIMALLDALELILAQVTQYMNESHVDDAPKPPAQPKGLLGNVTAGVFKPDGPANKTVHATSRLTIVLAFQDAVRVSSKLWTWGSRYSNQQDFDRLSSATSSYNALRVRNRTRQLLENAFGVEPLDSLEVIIAAWSQSTDENQSVAALDLLHVIPELKPKVVVQIILDALWSRTNPSAIPAIRHSCQTTELTALEVALFLLAYLESTEDDAMDEIWSDCMGFLKDVLSNPLPYRQILPTLLSIITLLAQKIENTNFGDQRRMRRELGDLFSRLLAATFAAVPSGAVELQSASPNGSEGSSTQRPISLAAVLNQVTEHIEIIVDSPDRVTTVINTITTSFIATAFHSKSFPTNITPDVLSLIASISKKAPTAKPWKKEVNDAFGDPKILLCSTEHMETDWFPVMRQWCLYDKERMSELLSRLIAPSSAGIMFGVGASAARLEADRKAQLNLRRLCLLLLASAEDTFVSDLRAIEEKLVELFEASPSSSPSSAVKSELFMVCRALILSLSAAPLASLWPLLNHKLQSALLSLLPNSSSGNAFSNVSLLQACKLLDLLVACSPDEFQLHEWLYISDTIDAGQQPSDWTPTALSDQIAQSLGSEEPEDMLSPVTPTRISSGAAGRRQPLLHNKNLPHKDDIKAMTREDFVRAVLRPFFGQLSLHAYEGVYSMDVPDTTLCRRNLLEDVLDLSTIAE